VGSNIGSILFVSVSSGPVTPSAAVNLRFVAISSLTKMPSSWSRETR
jgi:hypothetical protein